MTVDLPYEKPDPIFSIIEARDNAEVIEKIATHPANLGYLDASWLVLDATYGEGKFWTRWRPRRLIGCDINPAKSQIGRPVDFRPGIHGFAPKTFHAVFIDPPYKLNGTSTGEGVSASDESYGVEEYASRDDRVGLQFDMLTAGAEVIKPARRKIPGTRRTEMKGGFIFVKGQPMVNGGKMQWTTRQLANHGESLGLRVIAEFHFLSYRDQPPRCLCTHTRKAHIAHPEPGCPSCDCTEFRLDKSQDHPRINFSTFIVFRDERLWEPDTEPTLWVPDEHASVC